METPLSESWRKAGADLGIEVRVRGDKVVLPEFGSPAGMLYGVPPTEEGERELRQEAEAQGIGWSILGSAYLRYDRELFIDTLNDWGWCGEGDPPSWYTGEPWTN